MSNELLGDDLYIFYDTDNDYDVPVWEKQISLGDVGFDPQNEQVEIPKRIPVKTYKKGRGDWTLTFSMNYDPGNAFHMAVRDSLTAGTKIHLAIADGPDPDEASYWHAWWFLSGPLDGSLDNPAGIDVEGKVHFDTGTDDDELPAFVPATPGP